MTISFLDCDHNRVQEFTEFCLDCGYNIYTSKEAYLKDLQRKVDKKRAEEERSSRETALINAIRELEHELNDDR